MIEIRGFASGLPSSDFEGESKNRLSSFLSAIRESRLIYERLGNQRFLKSVLAVSSGNFLGAGTQIFFAPILGRIYTPYDYGLLGAYLGVAALLVGLGNWQYSQAIVVERSDRNAVVLFAGCLLATSITAILSGAVSILVISMADRFGIIGNRWWYAMLPVSALVAGWTGALAAMANRKGLYGRIGAIMFLPGLVTAVLSVLLGLYFKDGVGLFVSYLVGQLLALWMYWVVVRSPFGKGVRVTYPRMMAMMRKHHRFALFTTPTGFLTTVSFNSPVYVLAASGATNAIGLFSRANQLLMMPIQLIGNSIAIVFQREAAIQYQDQGTCWAIFKRTLATLLAIGIVPTVILAAIAPQLFTLVLGPNWTDAGNYARILAPMLLLRTVCSPLSTVFYIAGKQKEDFLLSIATSLLMFACIAVGYAMFGTPIAVVAGFSVGYSIAYLVYIVRSAQHCVRRT